MAETRGGRRVGSGRPKGTVKGYSIARAQHQLRAHPEEWELIKAFAKIVKEDSDRAVKILRFGKDGSK